MQYVVFNLLTGDPVKWGQTQEENLDLQAGPGEKALATSSLNVEGNRPIVWEQVKAQRDFHINNGAPTSFGSVDSDEISRTNISGATIAAVVSKQANTPFSIVWTMQDNSTVTLNADQMIQLGLEVVQYINQMHSVARSYREAIENALSMAELLAIDVTANW